MEILSAHQAYFFLEPLKPAGVILKVHEYLKKEIPFAKEDRLYAKDVALINNEIESGNLLKIIRANVKGK
jgi:histidine ammonia-lyase